MLIAISQGMVEKPREAPHWLKVSFALMCCGGTWLFFHCVSPLLQDLRLRLGYAAGLPVKLDSSTRVLINHDVSWIVQISDIHISINSPKRNHDFQRFCSDVLRVIDPEAVFATGDLVHGMEENGLSVLIKEEWIEYRRILKSTGWFNESVWFDLPGNHDCRNVKSQAIEENPFKEYAVQGRKYDGSGVVFSKSGHGWNAYGIQECLQPGWKRGLSFFGEIKKEHLLDIEESLSLSERDSTIGLTFGHFPLSMVSTSSRFLNELFIKFNAPYYFCGHIHNGMGKNLFSRKTNGLIEAESWDFKDNRRYRIISIDHGLVQFHDMHMDSFPLMIVTSPKSSSQLSLFDPVDKTNKLHVVVFHSADLISSLAVPVVSSKAKTPTAMRPIKRGSTWILYEMEWSIDPHSIGHFLNLDMELLFANGSLATSLSHQVSLDRSVSPLGTSIAHTFLNVYFPVLLMILFFVLWFTIFVFCLPFGRWSAFHWVKWNLDHEVIKDHIIRKNVWLISFSKYETFQQALEWFLLRLSHCCKDNTFFWGYTCIGFILLCCPLKIGKILNDSKGMVFSWGVVHLEQERIKMYLNLTDAWIGAFHRILYGITPILAYLILSAQTEETTGSNRFHWISWSTAVLPLYWLFREYRYLRVVAINNGFAALFVSPGIIFLDGLQLLLIRNNLRNRFRRRM